MKNSLIVILLLIISYPLTGQHGFNKCNNCTDGGSVSVYELTCDDLEAQAKCINAIVVHPDPPANLDNDPTNELQTLSVGGNANTGTTSITLSNGNTVQILHPNHNLTAEECTGPFHRAGRDGWSNGDWQPIQTINSGLLTLDWDNIGPERVVPSCSGTMDMVVIGTLGTVHVQNRRNRLNYYIDTRLLINGAPVLTWNTQGRVFEDEIQDTNPDHIPVPQYQTRYGGGVQYERLSVPAGATVQLQSRVRYRFVGSQTSAWGRVTGPLYPTASYHFEQRNEIEEVSIAKNKRDQYWSIIDEANALVYGIGDPPKGATIYNNENQLSRAVEKIETGLIERMQSFATKGLTKEQIKDLGL